jgi:hypothetical protein
MLLPYGLKIDNFRLENQRTYNFEPTIISENPIGFHVFVLPHDLQ